MRARHDPDRQASLRRPSIVALILCGSAVVGSSASADPLPDRVGACSDTAVMRVGPRLSGDPRSGSGILYENGGTQVSYEVVAALLRSRKGDRVRLCLASIPTGCPPGDVRGRVYRATNLRTNGSWTAPDSQHTCGGA